MKKPVYEFNARVKVEIFATQAQSKIQISQIKELFVRSITVKTTDEGITYVYGLSQYDCAATAHAPLLQVEEEELIALNSMSAMESFKQKFRIP